MKIAQHEERLRDLKAQAKRLERAADRRRKYLYGEAYLAMIETISGDQRERSMSRVHEAITDPKKRAFLGLPARPVFLSGDSNASEADRRLELQPSPKPDESQIWHGDPADAPGQGELPLS